MDLTKAKNYWRDRDAKTVALPRQDLQRAIENFLAGHHTCALATSDLEGNVRNTPLDYFYADGAFWLMTEGGEKFAGLAVNAKVSLTVFEEFQSFKKIMGLQVQGLATIYTYGMPEYLAYLKMRKIPEERFAALPTRLYLIKVTPLVYDYLDGGLKAQGFGSRQRLQITDEDK